MSYSLNDIRRIEVEIIDQTGQKSGMAFLYPGRGWLIVNNQFRCIGVARKKRDIIRIFQFGMDKIGHPPSRRHLCDQCKLIPISGVIQNEFSLLSHPCPILTRFFWN